MKVSSVLTWVLAGGDGGGLETLVVGGQGLPTTPLPGGVTVEREGQ